MGFSALAALLQRLPQQTQQRAPQFAAPAVNQNARSIFDLLVRPQQAQFDVKAATGTKPKNYTPASVTMSGLPAASVFAFNPGALPQQAFTVIPASGTKAKNYKPAQVQMNAPSLAGPEAMQQMLALMRGTATPFSPFGQGQG
jgi:hypothetical protein